MWQKLTGQRKLSRENNEIIKDVLLLYLTRKCRHTLLPICQPSILNQSVNFYDLAQLIHRLTAAPCCNSNPRITNVFWIQHQLKIGAKVRHIQLSYNIKKCLFEFFFEQP